MNAALSICSAAARMRAVSKGVRAAVRRAARAASKAARSRCRPRASARHCSTSCVQASSSGLVGRVAFCAAASCAAVNGWSTSCRLWAAHSRSWVERRDQAVMVSLIDAGQLGHPGRRVDGRPFQAQGLVQFAAQGGLIDHPGRAGFVIQRRPVDGHHDAVGAGLAVGHDDVGVQVRVPAPRGLVLIGDRRQPGQAHEVFLAGVRVVDPGVAGMGGQVFHRLGDRGGVGVGDRLGQHIVIAAQRPHERHALGCAERQIEAVHTALPEGAPLRTVGCDAVVEPAGHQPRRRPHRRRAGHR